MSDIIKCEEVLGGLSVNWLDYEPSGGKTWSKVFHEGIAPVMRESRANAEKQIAYNADRLRNIAKVQSLSAEILSKANELASAITYLDAAPEDSLDLQSSTGGMLAGARRIFNFADALLSVGDAVTAQREISEDIRFFNAFDAYISADAELDKLLFAMHQVDVRYRAKILRACCRLLAVVEENREVLRNSKSVVFKNLGNRLTPIFDTLDKAYALTGKQLRRMKKKYAKNGPAALADF